MKNDDIISSQNNPNRRSFIKGIGGAVAGVTLLGTANQSMGKSHVSGDKKSTTSLPLSTNSYPWFTFYQRQNRNWENELPKVISEIKISGSDCLEPNLKSVEFTDTLSAELEKQGIGMISVYVGSELHEKEKAKTSIDGILAIVKRAKKLMGTQIVVTNPNPINWGTEENKTDEQLEVQRDALNDLGQAISSEGMTLAYHFHAPEFRAGAREFHHMMASTNPEHVKMCLDSHWVFRGTGDSNVALHDVVKLYGDRVVELHLRQSRGGIWTETFEDGDIDHPRLARELEAIGVRPLVTMEQCVEAQSPNTMDSLAAHKISHAEVRKVFASFIS
jgi:inosose dehydratase